MKKCIVILSILMEIALISWLSCNPFQQNRNDPTKLSVLDETGSARLTITCAIEINGTTWDGGGMTIIGEGQAFNDQGETYPMFNVTNGTVKNFVIGSPVISMCISLNGNCTVENVTVPDTGDHAVVSVKTPGTSTVTNTTASEADQVFQINNLCTITFKNTIAKNINKMVRQNGGKTWKCIVYIDGADLNGVKEAVWRSDSSTSKCYYRNLTVTNYTGTLGWWYGRDSQAIQY